MKGKQYKIGFIGTHGTGKTTEAYELATSLKKKGYDVNIISEVARSCPYPINEKATIRSQLWIFTEMLKRELMSNSKITICDRTLMDTYAYTKRIDPLIAKYLFPFIEEWMNTYDLFIYMQPKRGYLTKDGIRSVNQKFQRQIKENLDGIIEEYYHEDPKLYYYKSHKLLLQKVSFLLEKKRNNDK